MRITQRLMQNLVRQNTDRASRAVLDASRPIDEGTNISRPSQDPVTAARLMGLRDLDAQFDRLDRNRNIVKTDLAQAEDVLGGVHELIVRAQEIANGMANDTANASDRQSAAREVRIILSQAVGLANRKDASGKYFFGGTAENRPAFAADGTYQGNEQSRMVEIGAGLQLEATIVGPDVFGPKTEGLTSIERLAVALESNDLSAIQASIDELAEARQIVSDGRTEIGGRLSTITDIDDIMLSLRTHVGLERAAVEGVDIAAVAPAMSSAQASLEAVVASSRSLMAQIGRGLLGG